MFQESTTSTSRGSSIMQTFGSWFKIPILAIILQAVIFAAVHGYNSLGIIAVFISGIVFGFFTWKTNGIEVSWSSLNIFNAGIK